MVWHTQTYRYPGFPEIRRAYPLYASHRDVVEDLRQCRPLEAEMARTLPAWTTFRAGQVMADPQLPEYAKTLMLYRGQHEISWPLMPTLYRRPAAGETLQSALEPRRAQRQAVVDKIVSGAKAGAAVA